MARRLRLLPLAFGATAFAIALVAGEAYQSVRHSTRSNERVVHTQRVLAALEQLLGTVLEADAATRTYAATHDAVALEPFRRAEVAVPPELDALDALVADNPGQRTRVTELRPLITSAVRDLEAMQRTGAGPKAAAGAADHERAGMEAIRTTLRTMRVEEHRLLDVRIASDREATRRTQIIMIATILIASAVIVLGYLALEREASQRERLAAQLREANQDLESRVAARTRELQVALENETRARVEAQQADRLKDEFLMTVSHELRTPLTSIFGWARMLARGEIRDSQKQRALDAIERNAVAQTQLVDDLLDVSRTISGKLRLDVRPVDPGSVIHAAIDAVQPAADAKHIELTCRLDPQVGRVAGDPDRLQQVVWNLLSNAIKFTPSAGRVEVRLTGNGPQADITVSDTGRGIAPEFLPYVFDRFRQQDGGTTRAQGGLGLGLAIVRHLVELHGGQVSAESAGEGRGATFRVTLPLVSTAHEQAPRAADQASGTPSELRGSRVLVVDDEAQARELFATVLENAGAEVRSAGSARQALTLLESWTPDVLVSDIEMPQEDGYSLVKKARALRNGNHLVAIAVTAHARPEDRARALESGFGWHLAKPVEPSDLVAVVSTLRRAAPDVSR